MRIYAVMFENSGSKLQKFDIFYIDSKFYHCHIF